MRRTIRYIAANNRDDGRLGDCGGAIQRIDAVGNVTDFTSLTSSLPCTNGPLTALGEPAGLAFGPGDPFGTDLFVANSSDIPADILRVDPSGAARIFVDDGKFFPSTPSGLAPLDLEFGPGGAFGNLLYFTDFGEECNCVRRVDSAGNFSAPFVTLPGLTSALKFGPGGPFGEDLYVTAVGPSGGSIYRVKADGTFHLFATGFVNFTTDALEFSPDGSALFVADFRGKTVYKITPVPATHTHVRLIDTLSTADIVLDPSSFSRPPSSVTTDSLNHRTIIEWQFGTFSVGQIEDLSFEVILKDPLPGEDRLVNHKLELLYTDINGNPVRTELGPQFVHVLTSAFSTTVSTDKAQYAANEEVLIDLSITNSSEFARTVDAVVEIEDRQGNRVQSVTTLSGLSFAAGETQTFPGLLFHTGKTFAGDYRVHAWLIDGGSLVGETRADFAILALKAAASHIASDKTAYSSNETVTLTSTVTSESPNSSLTGLEATVRVTDPFGLPLWDETRVLSDLLPEARVAFRSFTNTGIYPAGLYTATLQVRSNGGPLTSATTHFEVLSSLAQARALSGSIGVNPSAIFEKESTTLAYTLQNTGNDVDLPMVQVEILVVDPDTEQPVRTLTDETSLNGREVFANRVLFDSTGLAPKPYLVVLRGTTAGVTQALDSAGLQINPIPNNAPVADAGPDSFGFVGQPVWLDGTASADPDGDLLSFDWHFASVPGTSQLTDASLADATTPTPSFTPDVEGIYTLSLTVNDGLLDSAANRVSVFVNPPISVDIHPETINLKNHGGSKSITGVLSSPSLNSFAPLTSQDGITVIATFSLENTFKDQYGNIVIFTIPAEDYPGDDRVVPVDKDNDGSIDFYQLTLKFNRDHLIAGFTGQAGELLIVEPTTLTSTVIEGKIGVIGSDVNTVISPAEVSRGGK